MKYYSLIVSPFLDVLHLLKPPCLSVSHLCPQVQEHLEDLLVSPGDVIALQHDAGAGLLLRCPPSPLSPWRQPILAINQSEWFWASGAGPASDGSADKDFEDALLPDPELDVEALVNDGEGGWLAEVVCPIRVLYAGHAETLLQGAQLSAGLPQPGLFTMLVSAALMQHRPLCDVERNLWTDGFESSAGDFR